MAADRIHLAEPAPAHCSSCFGQYPARAHVDFDAAWDGPVIGEGVTMHVIDDLVICDECIKTAARLIGYGDVVAVEAELKHAEETADNYLEQIVEMRRYVARLEEARDGRPAFLDPDPPRKPRAKTKRERITA
jgi:hypothetical protein